MDLKCMAGAEGTGGAQDPPSRYKAHPLYMMCLGVCLFGVDVRKVTLLWCYVVCCSGTNRPSSMHVDDYETHAR
jgi:hypothetical protein